MEPSTRTRPLARDRVSDIAELIRVRNEAHPLGLTRLTRAALDRMLPAVADRLGLVAERAETPAAPGWSTWLCWTPSGDYAGRVCVRDGAVAAEWRSAR